MKLYTNRDSKMYVNRFLTSANLILTLAGVFSEQMLSKNISELIRMPLRELVERRESLHPISNDIQSTSSPLSIIENEKRKIRSNTSLERKQLSSSSEEGNDDLQPIEAGWTRINEEVDTVIPLFLVHLSKLGIEELQLPDMEETISVSPLLITYTTGLFLNNGILYNIEGVRRFGDAFMTYADKTFLSRFNLILNTVQFEYDFLLKFMALEGYGKVIGSLNDAIIYAELAVDVENITLKLNDFRIKEFRTIHVQLDQIQIIRQITGLILSPITNLFKDRITTSISDGLKGQMQMLMDDFNHDDPLELRAFAKKLLASLLGQTLHKDN